MLPGEAVQLRRCRTLRLTLRQLYYQLVSRAIIPNEEKSYKNLGGLVSDARLAGLVDWDAIEDRVRVPRHPPEFDSLADLVEAAVNSYRLPRWDGQENYVELWVEKDALAGVLAPIAREYHVTLMVNRGYSSQSAMYESAKRFRAHRYGKSGSAKPGQLRDTRDDALVRSLVLLYLGDHDPSGEDMVRDVEDRLAMFGVRVDVRKLALTMDQVREYNPPPNPAKITDSRARAYIEKYGDESWEVDALPPEVLTQIIEDELDTLVDRELMDQIMAREEEGKKILRTAVEGMGEA